MAERAGRDGEAELGDGEATPAVANNYYYRYFRPTLQSTGLRNMRELLTLCTVFDHLAQGRPKAAADTVAQRIKAVERAALNGHWGQAECLDLIDADGGAVTTKGE